MFNKNRMACTLDVGSVMLLFDNICWICQSIEDITKHHVIPKAFKPKKNMVIPLCRECHDTMHLGEASRLKIHNLTKKVKKLEKEQKN